MEGGCGRGKKAMVGGGAGGAGWEMDFPGALGEWEASGASAASAPGVFADRGSAGQSGGMDAGPESISFSRGGSESVANDHECGGGGDVALGGVAFAGFKGG